MSIMVARNGAAEWAGSMLSRSSRNGMKEPRTMDIFMIKKSDIPIAIVLVKSGDIK